MFANSYVHTNLYLFLYLSTCVYTHGEFIHIESVLIQNYRVHSSLLCLFVTSFFDSEKPGFHQLQLIYLFVQPQYTCIVVSELLTYTPVRNKFTKESKAFMYSRISFSLMIASQDTFPKLLWSAHFLPSISVRLYHIFVIQLHLLVCIPPLPPPSWLILKICIQ